MRSSNLIGQENRLIYRNLSDFNDQTRYNSRTAELNADQQAAQYQAQLSLNQSTGQRTSDPNFQTAAKVPVSQGLQDARTVYNTGGSTTYSQTPGTYAGTTGTVKPTLQFGQQVTDAMGSFQAPTLQGSNNSNPTPGQEPIPSTSTGGMKDPTFYGQWGNEADMAAYEQRKTELLKQQQLKQQMDQADATKNTASSAASTAATQQNNAGLTQNDQMAKFEPMLAGLPPEDAAALRASLQSAFSSSDTQTGLAQKSYNAEIKAADQSMNAYDKVLSQQRQDSTDLYKASQGFLDDAQKRREEATAKANENAQEQLKWQENKAVRQQKAANDKRLNQLVLGQAIGGGFGSSNWTAEVVDAEWEGEQAVIDLQKEFGFKRADVDIAFTEQLNGIYEFYGSQKLDALKTYKAELQNNSNLRFQAADKTETRKADARTKLNDTLAQIAKDQASEIKDATKEVRNTLKDLRAEKRSEEQTKKANAYSMFTWAFSNTEDASLRRLALKQMSDAGYDVSQINVGAMTFDGLEQLRKIEEDQAITDSEAMLATMGDEYSQATEFLRNAVRGSKGVTVKSMPDEIARNLQLLESGKEQQFRDNLLTFAVGKMGVDEAKAFRVRHNANIAIGEVNAELEKLGKDYGGRWKSIIENGKTFFELLDKDQKFAGLKAKIGYAQSQMRNELFGAALSPQEKAIADEFLVEWGTDEGLTAMTKLKELSTNINRDLSTSFDSLAGNGAYEYITKGRTQATAEPQPSMGTMDILNIMRGGTYSPSGGGGEPPEEGEVMETSFLSGTITGYGSKYWEAGLDVAAPKNTPIKTPIGGVVEKVVYNPTWAGHPNDPAKGKQQNGGFGNQVIVRYPDGVKIQFSHASKVAFGKDMEGKPVDPGAILAYVGNTGNTYGNTGVHADITGYKPDGTLMTAKEVAKWMLANSHTA